MFRVPTYLAPSPIHGIGVFTPSPLPAGEVIWDFTEGVDWKLTADEVEAFPERFREKLISWCYQEEETGLFVLCGDNARFMNHSDHPSCDDTGAVTVVARPLEAGEELTCDYRAFDVMSRGGALREMLAQSAGGG